MYNIGKIIDINVLYQLFRSKIQKRIRGEDDSFDDEIIPRNNNNDKINPDDNRRFNFHDNNESFHSSIDGDEIINTNSKPDKIIPRGGDKGINLDEYTTYNLGDGIIRNDKGDEINVNDILPENDNEPAVHYRDIFHDSSVREDLKARSFGNIGSTAEHTRLKEAFEAYRRSYNDTDDNGIVDLKDQRQKLDELRLRAEEYVVLKRGNRWDGTEAWPTDRHRSRRQTL